MIKIIAAGRGATMSLKPIVSKILELSNKTNPKILYLGTASYDREEPYRIQTSGLRDVVGNHSICRLNISERPLSDPNRHDFKVPSRDEMEDAIYGSDVVLASGGNTAYAIKRWEELGLDDLIRQRVGCSSLQAGNTREEEESPVLCGGSAGAICWFTHGHSDSMNPTTFLNVDPNLTEEEKTGWDYIRVHGLGYIPALCVPHYDATQSNGQPRSVDSDAMLMQYPEEPSLGIDENAALIVVGNTASVVSGDGRAKCYSKVVCMGDSEDEHMIEVTTLDQSLGEIPLSEALGGLYA